MPGVRAGASAVARAMCGVFLCRVFALICGLLSYAEGGPCLLQDVWVCSPEVVQGAEEGPLDSGHVLLREPGVVLGGGGAGPGQDHEGSRHHEWAELQGGRAWGDGSSAVWWASLC